MRTQTLIQHTPESNIIGIIYSVHCDAIRTLEIQRGKISVLWSDFVWFYQIVWFVVSVWPFLTLSGCLFCVWVYVVWRRFEYWHVLENNDFICTKPQNNGSMWLKRNYHWYHCEFVNYSVCFWFFLLSLPSSLPLLHVLKYSMYSCEHLLKYQNDEFPPIFESTVFFNHNIAFVHSLSKIIRWSLFSLFLYLPFSPFHLQ